MNGSISKRSWSVGTRLIRLCLRIRPASQHDCGDAGKDYGLDQPTFGSLMHGARGAQANQDRRTALHNVVKTRQIRLWLGRECSQRPTEAHRRAGADRDRQIAHSAHITLSERFDEREELDVRTVSSGRGRGSGDALIAVRSKRVPGTAGGSCSSSRVAAYRLAWRLAPPLGPRPGPLPRMSPVETSLTQSEPLPL